MVWSSNLVLGLYLLGANLKETTYFGVSVYPNLATSWIEFHRHK